MSVTTETATVYKGGGRRWFTRDAAVRAEGKQLYRQAIGRKDRCECESVSDDAFGDYNYPCKYHDYDSGIRARYMRFTAHQIQKATP
jgi:hypothetical protein